MTIDVVKISTSEVITATNSVIEIFFLVKNVAGTLLKKADFGQDALIELKNQFINELQDKILDNEDLSLMNATEADQRRNVLFNYDVPDNEKHSDILKLNDVIQQQHTTIPTFSFSNDGTHNIKAVIILIGNHTRQIVLYKHMYPISLFNPSHLFYFHRTNRIIENIDSDIIRINQEFDFLLLNNNYYIFNIKLLEKYYGFTNTIARVANDYLQRIDTTNIVDDINTLRGRMQDLAFARKLAKAANASPVIGTVPNNDIINFIINHPVLRTKITIDPTGSKVLLSTKNSQNAFVKLLTDDYLHSLLTNIDYNALAKDNL